MQGRITRKWRPPLLLVLGGALASGLAAPILGLLSMQAMSDTLGARQSAIIISLTVLVLTAVLAFLLWRLLLRPIRALAARAELLKTGARVAEPLDHYGTQELRDLGESVLDMATVLHNRETTIRSFTDHVTHELKTPITAIIGAAEVLDAVDTLDHDDRRLVTTILTSARQMEDQLRALRRIAMAREPTHRGTSRLSDLATALRDAFPAVNIVTSGAEVELPLNCGGLEIVLTQIIGNSAAHGALTVTLDAQDGRHGVTLTITDDGTGISPGNRDRIFDPFFTTRRDAGGTGMGLSIVRSLLQAHGATIGLTPGGGGTSFVIAF